MNQGYGQGSAVTYISFCFGASFALWLQLYADDGEAGLLMVRLGSLLQCPVTGQEALDANYSTEGLTWP